MWALILAIYINQSGSHAVSSQTIQGFSSQQECEVAGERVLGLSRGHQRANVIYTCVQVK